MSQGIVFQCSTSGTLHQLIPTWADRQLPGGWCYPPMAEHICHYDTLTRAQTLRCSCIWRLSSSQEPAGQLPWLPNCTQQVHAGLLCSKSSRTHWCEYEVCSLKQDISTDPKNKRMCSYQSQKGPSWPTQIAVVLQVPPAYQELAVKS